jgi:hypothetical protein
MRWRALEVAAGWSVGGALSQGLLVGVLVAAVLCAACLVAWRAGHRRAGAAPFSSGLGVGLARRARIGAVLLGAAALLLAVGFAVAQWVASSQSASANGLDSAQERNARIIIGVAIARGLGGTGAAIGVAAALAESSLYNYANDGTSTLVGTVEGRQLTAAERAVARESLNYPHDGVGNNLDSIGLLMRMPRHAQARCSCLSIIAEPLSIYRESGMPRAARPLRSAASSRTVSSRRAHRYPVNTRL